MTIVLSWLGLGVAVLFASVLGGVLGFGTGGILLPILSLLLGVQNAVPVLGVAMVLANASRSVFSWKEIDWKAVLAFSAAAVPMSIAGAVLFAGMRPQWTTLVIGILILAMVPLRRIAAKRNLKMRLSHLPWLGAPIGFVTGVGGAIGPASAPFLISYGLVKGAYLGTDGINSTLIHCVRCVVYWNRGAMTPHHLLIGSGLGIVMVLGSFLGRRLVDRLNAESFTNIVEAFLIALGLIMVIQSLFQKSNQSQIPSTSNKPQQVEIFESRH